MTEHNVDPRTFDAAREGDRSTFDMLAEKAKHRVAAFVNSRICADYRGRLDVDEIVQDTLVRAFQSIAGFRGDEFELFVRWLLGVARIAVIRAVRQATGADLELAAEPIDSAVSPSRAMRRHDRFDRLQNALDGLSDDYREVVYLARIEGLPMKEVARRMGRSTDAVKKLMGRALEKLRERMGETASLGLPNRELRRDGGSDV